MNQTNATGMQPRIKPQVQKPNTDSKLKKRKRSAAADAKADFTADFVVGALLYSLLGSNRSESIIPFLPEDEQD